MTEATAKRSPLAGAGGFLPWLTSLRRDLRRLVADATATKEERELLHLFEYAASRHGDVLLHAADLDDLDDRLDDLLDDPTVFRWNALVTPLALQASRSAPEPWQDFAAPVEAAVGAAQVKTLEAEAPLLEAWTNAQRDVLSQMSEEEASRAAEALADSGPSLLTTPDAPPELTAALAGGLRAGLSMLAIARAVEQGSAVPPWLARGLVERFLNGARAHLSLLAAVAETSVPESVLPREERLDLVAIQERHRRARARADKTFEIARRRLARDA